MAQFSVKIMRLTGSVLGENQQPGHIWAKIHGASTDVISGQRGLIGGWNEHKREGQVRYIRADLAHPAPAPAVPVEGIDVDSVSQAMEDDAGLWLSCSGCHEVNDGYPTGPHSKALKCHLGVGCSECGGVGAVWDTTDYAEMGDWLAKELVVDADREAVLRAQQPTPAARDVLAERQRQISAEGWTPEHDDQHGDGEIAAAAATYALSAANCIAEQPYHRTWPWQNGWWKPTTPRRDLVKAGALILAEIERRDRAAALSGEAQR